MAEDNGLGQHETSDMGEAAYFFLMGFQVKFDRRNENRVVCIFTGDAGLLKMKALDYFEFRTKVDARRYFDALKQIKKAILEGKPRQ